MRRKPKGGGGEWAVTQNPGKMLSRGHKTKRDEGGKWKKCSGEKNGRLTMDKSLKKSCFQPYGQKSDNAFL